MKHLKWAVGVLLLAIVPVFAWVSVAHAQRFSNSIDKDQTVDSSVYSGGKNIDINGTINGDVFCAGQTITVDATVNGDVICAGQDVTINGKVTGDVRVAGQTVSMNAKVSGSATVAAMSFSLDADAAVGRDLTVTGDSMNIKGNVLRDVVASGNALTFNNTIGRNLKADGTNIKLKDGAKVGGNFTYTSNKQADVAKNADVKGKTEQSRPKAGSNDTFFKKFNLGFYLFMLCGFLLVGLALAWLFPRFLQKNSSYIKNSFAKTLIVGLVASFLIPMLAIGLIVSLVGIPLTFFLLIAWLFGAALSGPVAGYFVGRLVFRDQPKNPVLIMLVGGAILVTAYFFPLAGILVLMLAYWLGLGALLLSLQEYTGQAKSKPAKTK